MPRPLLKRNFRTLFWIGAGLVLTLALLLAFRPRAVPADLAEVVEGPMTVWVRDEGRTRARELYVISAPLAGRLQRVGERAGQAVSAGEVVATLQPAAPSLDDARTRAEIQAAARSSQAALDLTRAELDRAEAQLAHARQAAARAESLFAAQVSAQAAVDRARLDLRTAQAAVANARAGVAVRQAELDAARARLGEPGVAPVEPGRAVAIRAPAAGRILRVLQPSESVVAAGAPILELGDPRDLEVVAELLSSDAAQIQAGALAEIIAWGGAPMRGKVRQVEPYGFLKISALGVEEQRVNVIIDPVDPPSDWALVGHGYRVEAAVSVWSAAQVTQVPVAALFRRGGEWAVFRAEGGRARLIPVEVGRNNGVMAEVLKGLAPGEQVVLHPGSDLSPGARLTSR